MIENYIQNAADDPLRPGALGLGEEIASTIVSIFYMISYATPLLAGILTDVYFGRFKTVLFSYGMYLLGVIVLFITSLPVLLRHGLGLPGLIVAMAFVSFGLGAIKASIPPYVAEQCSNIEEKILRLPDGERVLVSQQATVDYTFNLYYWSTNMGTLTRIAGTFMEKDVGFWSAFLLGMCSLCIGLLTVLIGRGHLVEVERQANAFTWAGKALKTSILKRLHIDVLDSDSIPWSDDFINELKSSMVVCYVFLPFVLYWLCQAQMTTNTVPQAANMQTHGIPNDLLPVIDALTVILVIPVLNHLLYPCLQK